MAFSIPCTNYKVFSWLTLMLSIENWLFSRPFKKFLVWNCLDLSVFPHFSTRFPQGMNGTNGEKSNLSLQKMGSLNQSCHKAREVQILIQTCSRLSNCYTLTRAHGKLMFHKQILNIIWEKIHLPSKMLISKVNSNPLKQVFKDLCKKIFHKTHGLVNHDFV